MKHFDNVANYNSHTDHEAELALELDYASIPLMEGGASIRRMLANREVETAIVGSLHGWLFVRCWHYWAVKGPGIDFASAMDLWKHHGKYIRANGDCGCRSPWLWTKGFAVTSYHIDTWQGLKIFADTVKNIHASAETIAEAYGVLGVQE